MPMMTSFSLISFLIFPLLSSVVTIPADLMVEPDYIDEVTALPMDFNTTLSTALATIGAIISNDTTSLNYDFYPTVHSAIMAPFSLFTGLCKDFFKFYDHRSVFQLFSFTNLKNAVMSMPNKLVKYWSRLIEMEMECVYRTICDFSAYLSPRLPYIVNQMLGVYFTTHSSDNTYFRALANGMINHNCVHYYPKCSPFDFIDRLTANVTDIITTTMSPMPAEVIKAIKKS